MSARSTLWLILGASLLWRGLIAWVLPLGTDEAYALAVGRDFSLSFFDHPPIGFWLPALAETWGAGTEFALRLPNLILGTIALWLLAETGRALGGERAMLWTASLGALAPFMAMSGLMILPDAPLYVGLTGAMYALIRLAQGDERLWLWAFGGMCLGLALASKYQAGLLPIALLIWIAVTPPAWRWLAQPGFWLALVLSLLGLAPVLIWNIGNEWASFAFHGGRAGGGLNLANFGQMVGAQLIYLSPAIAIWSTMRLGVRDLWADPVARLLMMIGLGPILMFNVIYLFSAGTLPHWTMPGWLFLLPLVGAWLAKGRSRTAGLWLVGTAVPIHLIVSVLALQAGTGVLTQARSPLPKWDNSVPLIPMTEARLALEESDILDGADLIAAMNWIKAGHVSAALGPDWPVRVLSNDPHHFQFMDGHAMTGAAVLLDVTLLGSATAALDRLVQEMEELGLDPVQPMIVPIRRGASDYFALIAIRVSIGSDQQ